MLRRLAFVLTAIAGFTITLPVAAIAPIASLADAIEADEITVSIHGNSGFAIARGCSGCPIKLDIDAKTRFFLRGAAVPRNKAEQLSGETGALVFSDDRVIRIRWSAGSLK